MIEPDETSRADALIEELKRRPRALQFSAGRLLGLTLLVALVLAIPRLTGASYAWYFGFLWVTAQLCVPLIGWATFVWIPPAIARWRILGTLTVVAAVVVPFAVYLVWTYGLAELLLGATIALLGCWIPQAAAIAFVRAVVFKKTSLRRKV